MQFTKIKYDGSKVELRWITENSESTQRETKLVCSDEPNHDFTAALQGFIDEALHLLELPTDYNRSLKVTGLSINYEAEDERRGLVVTMQKTLSNTNSPLILNTPHLREEMPDEQQGGCFLPASMLERLEDACKAASDYANGHRQQGDIFADAAE